MLFRQYLRPKLTSMACVPTYPTIDEENFKVNLKRQEGSALPNYENLMLHQHDSNERALRYL